MFAKQTLRSASLLVILGGLPATVRAEPDPPSSTDGEAHPPGTVVPTPQPTGRFEIGAGFSTDDKFIARVGISQSNLLGTGDLLSLDAAISQRRQLFVMRFVDPDVLGSHYAFGADLYNDQRVMPGFTRAASGTTLTLSRQLGDHVRAYAGYRLEHVETDDASIVARGEVPTTLRGFDLSALRAGIEYSTLDNRMLPRRGSSAGASLEWADPRFGSDVQLSTVRGWASTHQPLGPFTLHLGGAVTAIGGRDGVPLSERLFLDGSRDVRGYAPGGIGPVGGGNLELTGRAELEVPLGRWLSAVGFFDAGAIYDDRGNGGFGRSTGFGLIWRSPLGPLRLDYAIPLDGGSPRLVFGLGAMF